MITSHDKIDLVYIMGCGRSGSTLLDLVLSAHPDIVSVGEVRNHDQWMSKNYLCTCGANMQDCDFWSAVERALQRAGHPVRVTPVSSRRHKLGALLQLATGSGVLAGEGVGRYGGASHQLFVAVREVAGRRMVLDSSKDPWRLLLLHLSGRFNLKVIHLIRDGRAYLNARARKVAMPAQHARDYLPPQGAWRSTTRWLSVNALSEFICKRLGPGVTRLVRYEDFASQPEETTQRLCDFLGLVYHPAMLSGTPAAVHNISGSRWRFARGRVIRLDEAWRRELPANKLRVFNLWGRHYNRRFGYQ